MCHQSICKQLQKGKKKNLTCSLSDALITPTQRYPFVQNKTAKRSVKIPALAPVYKMLHIAWFYAVKAHFNNILERLPLPC